MAKKTSRLRLVDTTFRDAQQSLLGGQLRGDEIVPIAAKMDAIGFTAMEAFGGATFETQVRRREDPWEYLRNLHKATPNTPIQALIRGQNLLANRNFPDDVVELFIKHAARCGVDVFRIFDPLNDLRNMEATVAAALKAKKKVQGALCYAISPAHNLELWCSLAKGLVNMGCHEVVIKDTSGLLSPQATWELVAALKEVVVVPIDVHSHCSSGMAPMAYMAAVEAGAEILDVAMSPLAWGTSQPAVESVVAALKGGEYDTGLDLDKMWEVQVDVESLKRKHIANLSPVADRVDATTDRGSVDLALPAGPYDVDVSCSRGQGRVRVPNTPGARCHRCAVSAAPARAGRNPGRNRSLRSHGHQSSHGPALQVHQRQPAALRGDSPNLHGQRRRRGRRDGVDQLRAFQRTEHCLFQGAAWVGP